MHTCTLVLSVLLYSCHAMNGVLLHAVTFYNYAFFMGLFILLLFKCSKILTLFFSFCSQIRYWVLGLELTKWMSEWQTGKILIRLLIWVCTVSLGHFGRQLVFEIFEYWSLRPGRLPRLIIIQIIKRWIPSTLKQEGPRNLGRSPENDCL